MKKRNIVGGIVLIILGIVWILSNVGLINFDFFILFEALIDGLFYLWPLILVIIGINIIFRNKILNTILWIFFIVVLLIYGFFISDGEDVVYDEDMVIGLEETTSEGELNLDFGAIDYYLASSDSSENLLNINSNFKFDYEEETDNTKQKVDISNDFSSNIINNKNNIDIGLNNTIAWNINLNTGASTGDLNLENVRVENLDIDTGAGDLQVVFGDLNATTSIKIDAGASKIDFDIPEDAALKIEMDGGLNSTNLEDLGLIEPTDDVFISQDYEESASKFDIEVDMGAGSFKINRY